MNFPAAVIAAMALCNQHLVATSSNVWSGSITFGTGISYCTSIQGCEQPSKEELKRRNDAQTEANFNFGYAWAPEFQDKCSKIHAYVAKLYAEVGRDADNASAVKEKAAKAAEQPTLDKGISALPSISK